MALPCHWPTRPQILDYFHRPQLGEGLYSESVRWSFPSALRAETDQYQFMKRSPVLKRLQQLWNDEQGQDIAEYAVMLAVILVIVVGTIRLIGSNANNVFSQVGSAIQ